MIICGGHLTCKCMSIIYQLTGGVVDVISRKKMISVNIILKLKEQLEGQYQKRYIKRLRNILIE